MADAGLLGQGKGRRAQDGKWKELHYRFYYGDADLFISCHRSWHNPLKSIARTGHMQKTFSEA